MTQKPPIKLLSNANQILQVVGNEGALTHAEIAELSSIPRPTVYRLVDALGEAKLLDVSDGLVSLGLRWLLLSDRARAAMTEWRGIRPVLGRIVEITGHTAYLTVGRNGMAVCIDWVKGRGVDALALRPGRALPFNIGAAGKTFLAFNDFDLRKIDTSSKFTEHSTTDMTDLQVEIAQIRRRGYALSLEDVTVGIGAIGVPVHGGNAEVVGCVSIGGAVDEIRERHPELYETISQALETEDSRDAPSIFDT